MRNFNIHGQFEAIKTAAAEAVKSIFPIEGKLRRIELDSVTVEDTLDSKDYSGQSKVKAQGGTFGVPVYAALTLIDKQTGKVLDKSSKTRLFMLPKATDRFSYIVGGNEYQVQNQLRLKSGVYTVRKQNGELKTSVNLAQGKNFELVFNENTGIFTIAKVGGGQANIPLYPILTYLGLSHNMMSQSWGEALAASNKSTDPKSVARATVAFGIKRGELKDYLAKTKMDPENTTITLGTGFGRVDGPMLLAASKKLLDVHMGRKQPEDLNSLEFKEIHSLEDFIKERLEKNKDTLAFRIKRSIDSPNRVKVSQIVNPGAFSSVIESFFTQDDKSATPEQTNPLEMISGQYKATIMGSGGISSEHAVTDDMRNIHPTHYGFIDTVHTPESGRIGANLHIPLGAVKDGKNLKVLVVGKDGKGTALKASEAFNSVIAFPGQTGDKVRALHKGEVVEVARSKVDYFTPNPQMLFSTSTNMIPFLPANQGNRAMMAAKQMEQAIALKHREEPLVQVGFGKEGTIEKAIGKTVAVMAPDDGVVKKITDDYLLLTTKDGDVKINLYNNFSLNRKSYLHHEPVVKAGDKVKKGQLLADSNFTKNGTLALGANFRTAYVPYGGLNFDDGIVVTESAAEKLTSVHVYKKTLEIDENIITSLKTYRSQYPNVMAPENLNKLDDDGIIKKGQKVKMGETIIAALQKRAVSQQIGLIQRQLADRPKDISMIWGLEDDGLVTDVQKSGKIVSVFIKTEEKAKIGDKMSGRAGNKGIITRIIPDSEAPHNKDGKPVEVLLNPHGVISRINIGQIYESAAGKAAKKNGKPYVVSNFTGENYYDTTKKFLEKSEIDDKEELFDPKTGKSIGRVHVGDPYLLKLFKLSTSNFSTRQGGPGHPYDINLQPLKAGGEESAKSMDLLTVYSMLSHGSRANLREMSSLKANQNDEFWKALKSGQQLPPPKAPLVYDKFIAYLKAAGIDTKKDGSKITLAPLTDKEVKRMSAQEIKEVKFYRSKDMEPIKGGFFDPSLGGFKGTKWGHIELSEPVVNPVFENAVRKITGLGGKFDDIVNGKLHYHNGALNTEGKGATGGKAIEQILKGIDVDQEIKALLAKSKNAKGSVLDDINKKLRYLKALKTHDLRPEEAYIRKFLPVIPPQYRPVYTLPDGNVTSSDVNFLYQNVGVLNQLMKNPVMDLLPEEEKALLREDLYKHVKGVSGLTDINIKGRERAGFISEIKGGSGGQPKEGFFINKVLSKKQDYVGRGTIIPEPSLGVDEVALPEAMAWKLFEPFVIREMSRHGKTPLQAMDEIKNKTTLAKKALEIVMKDRKVLLNRAPSLHKFSIMAFKPQITSGTAIKIPPLVSKGFNADFDGDEQLTTILTCVDEETMPLLLTLFNEGQIRSRTMAARFKEIIPVKEGCKLMMFHLEDFPRGELIGTKEGEKGRIDFFKALPGFYVQAYSEKTGISEWAEVFGWSKHHDREIEIVDLESGRQIVTDDDERAVYGVKAGTLELVRCTPTQAVQDRILVPRVRTLEEPVEPTEPQFSVYGDIKFHHDEGFGYMLGSLVSNGWAESLHGKLTGRVVLSKSDADVTKKYNQICKRMLGKAASSFHQEEADNRYGSATKWQISCMPLAKLVKDLIGCGAENKHLPPFFLDSGREFRMGLFAGLMDNDGGVGVSNAKDKPQLMANYSSISLRLVQEVQFLAASLGINGRITPSKTPAGKPYWMMMLSNIDIKKWGGVGLASKEKVAKILETEVNENSTVAARYDIVPISSSLAAELQQAIGAPRNGSPQRKSLYTVVAKSKVSGSLSRISARCIPDWVPLSVLEKLPEFETFWKIVSNEKITWDKVKSFEKSGIKETGYDLTVPGYETFMNVEGVILSNTMTLHLPITDEANNEAERMLPSKNLYQPGTGKLMLLPSQEAQTGIFYLSKTPAGREKLNKILGKKYSVSAVLNKKETVSLLTRISKEASSGEFSNILNQLKAEGEKHAYEMGFTIGMEDLKDFSKERDNIVSKVEKITLQAKPSQMAAINQKATQLIDSVIEQKLRGKNNPLFDMIESGAKGSQSQLRSIVATPLFVSDSSGKIVPSPIKKSYSEGLDIGDYWTTMYGARRGMMDRAIQTSLPGAFSKDIMANTIDNVISDSDCGTNKGVILAIESQDIIDRLLAKPQGGMPRNAVVDAQTINKLKKAGVKMLEVRSPLTCLKAKGVCQKCYGLDENGQLPEIGENIGAKSGQTMSEPLVQLIMQTFHTGGVAGTGSDVTGYKRIDQLLKMPKVVAGSATLAPVTGKITAIVPSPAGGFDVTIGLTKARVLQGRNLKVKIGDSVEAGDPLSDGVIKPQDLVQHKGMQPAQEYMVDELKKAYSTQGVGLHRKVFETVIRSLGNTTQVLNNPKNSDFLPGDIIPYTVAQHYNENLMAEMPLEAAMGHTLAKNYGPLKKGIEITPKEAKLLRTLGHSKVEVEREAIQHSPVLKSVNTLPILKRNWMSALGYRNLAKALVEGAGQAWHTDLEDYHPVPAFAYGATFGQGDKGKY